MRFRLSGLLALGLLFMAVLPSARDEVHWRWTTLTSDTANYASYLASRPAGRHAADARRVIDERNWTKAVENNTPDSFARYIDESPRGVHASEAGQRIEELRWKSAVDAGTVLSYQAHIEEYPNGRYRSEASARQAALRTDDGPFTRARALGTKQSLEAFLREFPAHAREADARAALKDVEGRDIVDLIREKKSEVETQGSGIQSVQVRIRRLAPYPLTVRIPAGTFFVSRNSSSQNMVATAQAELRLASTDWSTVSVPAACANRPRDIPRGDDSFGIQRSPQQAELSRLMPVLEKAGVPYAVKQAAVWIVTDDASYSALGILVRGGARVIREEEAARAMQSCERAGLEIRNKSIWRDRADILQGLKEGDIKTWLAAKG